LKTLLVYILVFSLCYTNAYCQSIPREVTLDEVINRLSLESSSAKIELLNFQNDLLQYENYKKSFLPAFVLNFNPINFNRSLRLLQQPIDGSYSYVEDNSNNLYSYFFSSFKKKSFVSDYSLLIVLANKSAFSCRISY
jgi:outer membrane protein